MDAGGIRDFPGHLIFININDDNLGRVADIEAAARFVDGQVIPATFAADGDFFEKPISALGPRSACSRETEHASEGDS